MTTKTRIVRIGNSRGIRIPKTLLDEADLPEEAELHAQPGRLVVQAARRPRGGWAAAAKRMRLDAALLEALNAETTGGVEWIYPTGAAEEREPEGLEFLTDRDHVLARWKKYWPQRGRARTWDGIAKVPRGESYEWVTSLHSSGFRAQVRRGSQCDLCCATNAAVAHPALRISRWEEYICSQPCNYKPAIFVPHPRPQLVAGKREVLAANTEFVIRVLGASGERMRPTSRLWSGRHVSRPSCQADGDPLSDFYSDSWASQCDLRVCVSEQVLRKNGDTHYSHMIERLGRCWQMQSADHRAPVPS